jgi:hydroxymethylbilane synthase
MSTEKTIFIATRGSPLALAQANNLLAQCKAAFPNLNFELKIIKTTGDKMQTASLAQEGKSLPKGLFTKELEVALLENQADIAVHSLKDLPTELPGGLILGAVGKRADVRDVLIYPGIKYTGKGGAQRTVGIKDLPRNATVGTSSTRRKAQLLEQRPDLKIIEHRGNVLTRIKKLTDSAELDAIILAAAGLGRLGYVIAEDGKLAGADVPQGVMAAVLDTSVMLPCVGQGAIGIETRGNDQRIAAVCSKLNHAETQHCVIAERAFLAAMGGGCQSPVAAYAEIKGDQVYLRAVSFRDGPARRAEGKRLVAEAAELGQQLAKELK